MAIQREADWDPHSQAGQQNQTALYDDMRRGCPIAFSESLGWSVFRHEDVMRALHDPTFSSAVSAHLSVPNGMDPPEHTDYRRVIDPYFSPARMAAFEPKCRALAEALISELPQSGEMDVMAGFADSFALQAQCAFLNWPVALHEPLREWIRKNHDATRRRDRAAMAAVAFEFDRHIREVLDETRTASRASPDDIAGQLLREQVRNRRLTDEEIVSVLRNWTVGELATISACIGIVVYFVAARPPLQSQLREQPTLLPAAIDEMLRIESPFAMSRRIAKVSAKIGERHIEPGERVTLMWASANRDECVFDRPEEFRIERDAAKNLLYGAGIHVCPGAPLARLELRVIMEELLAAMDLTMAPVAKPINAIYPSSGYATCPVRFSKR